MAEIKLADFGTGMDTRRSASTSNPKSFRDIENCHITTGRTLKKRGGFKHIATLPANTAGLMAYNGALNIFKATHNLAVFPTVPAANVATAINGDTTPFITHELERTSPNMTAFTATTRTGNQALNAYDVRHVHFAESFNATPYVIVEHWDGSKSHHYLNHSILRNRATAWRKGVAINNNMITPSIGSTVPFVFDIKGTDPLASEPYYGLKDYAQREVDKWTKIAEESYAAYQAALVPGVVSPELDNPYLTFHGGGTAPPINGFVMPTYVGLDPLQADMNIVALTPAAKDSNAAFTYAENSTYQSIYLTMIYRMQLEYDTLLASVGGIINQTAGWLAVLQKRVADATTAVVAAAGADLASSLGSVSSVVNTFIFGGTGNRPAQLPAARANLAAAQKALADFTAANHTDGGVDINIQASVALCKWKMDNYIALQAANLHRTAPVLLAGDAVWLNPKTTVLVAPKIVVVISGGTDAYAIAIDENETRYTQIKDSDLNQNNTIALNIASKLFVADGDRVQFSQTDDPTRWFFDSNDPALDSGWLPVGIKQSGAQQVTALGQQLGKLIAFFADSAQVWTVDPDPKMMAFNQAIEGVGTNHPYSIANISNDATFLHRTGFRSISTMQFNNNLTDLDVGSAIDKPVVAHLAAASLRKDTNTSALATGAIIDLATINETKVIAKSIGSLGQYWCAIGADMWVFTYSKVGKVAGWSRYTLPYEVQEITELNGTVYIRAGVDVYAYDPALLVDEVDGAAGTSVAVAASASFQYLSAKAAGRMKMFHSFDSIVIGAADMRFKFDVRNPAIETAAVPLTGDSNPDYLTPMQVSSTHISPVISSLQHFELEYLALYFNMLGRR